jgi:IclR family pca regulon transcriptional regulator
MSSERDESGAAPAAAWGERAGARRGGRTARGKSDADGGAPDAHADDRDFVTALARGLAVIQAFTNQSRQMTISQISYKTGITRAAVRRYLHTLAVLGYAHCHDGVRYSLSPKTASLGNAYLSGAPLTNFAQPVLDRLSDTVNEACSMAVLDGADIVYIARAASSRIMSPSLNVGSRLPAYATSIGQLLLAHLSPGDLEAYLRQVTFLPYAKQTITSAAALREELARIRSEGYAIADQQIEVGLRSIAVPVRDRKGAVVSGINIIANSTRVSLAQLRSRFLPLLQEAAEELSRHGA